jgi:hypothetical protein
MKPQPSQGLEIIWPSESDFTGVIGAGLYALQNLIKISPNRLEVSLLRACFYLLSLLIMCYYYILKHRATGGEGQVC